MFLDEFEIKNKETFQKLFNKEELFKKVPMSSINISENELNNIKIKKDLKIKKYLKNFKVKKRFPYLYSLILKNHRLQNNNKNNEIDILNNFMNERIDLFFKKLKISQELVHIKKKREEVKYATFKVKLGILKRQERLEKRRKLNSLNKNN